MGVVEARQHAASAEVDSLRARERGLVRPDAACDLIARDRECARDRERGFNRADDAVLQDHPGDCSGHRRPGT
jgi:hypothetical protein